MDLYLAMIIMFGGNFAIMGTALCYGQIMAISQNTALFSLLGTTFGGNGTSTFGLPDLRGRVPVGTGQGNGLSNYILGQIGGVETVTLAINQMPQHTHTFDATQLVSTPAASIAAATTNIPGPTLVPAKLPTQGAGPTASVIKGYAPVDVPNATTLSADAITTKNPPIAIAGGSQPHENMMPYLGISYLIALVGIFPSRN